MDRLVQGNEKDMINQSLFTTIVRKKASHKTSKSELDELQQQNSRNFQKSPVSQKQDFEGSVGKD